MAKIDVQQIIAYFKIFRLLVIIDSSKVMKEKAWDTPFVQNRGGLEWLCKG